MSEFPFSSEPDATDEQLRPVAPLPRRPDALESDDPGWADRDTLELPLAGFGSTPDPENNDWPGFGAYTAVRLRQLGDNIDAALRRGDANDARVLAAEFQAWQRGTPGPFPTGEQPPV